MSLVRGLAAPLWIERISSGDGRGPPGSDAALAAWRSANPDSARRWDAARAGQLPSDLGEILADVPGIDPVDGLKALVSSPNYGAKQWVYEQYDQQVMGDTARTPGLGAGIVRVHGTDKSLAFTSDVTPRYVKANPVEGGKQAVAEAWRNLTATGAVVGTTYYYWVKACNTWGCSDFSAFDTGYRHGLPPAARSDPAAPERIAWPRPGRDALTVGGVRISGIRTLDDVVYFEVGPAK